MASVNLKARAKINISLDVLGKRSDGYHDVRMIMQTIEMHDDIVIETCDKGIEILCSSPDIPSDSTNIAYKAAELLIREYNIGNGVRISIQKRIPVAAGLAGGSSDAASVMKGMNRLFSLGLEQEQLMCLGKRLGADVPYCIRGGTALAEGIGEVLTGLPSFPGVNMVLVKPKINVSTPWVYKSLDLGKISARPDTDLLICAIRENNIDAVSKNMRNVLETVTAEKYGEIAELKERLVNLGALGSIMSGSGPSVFGIFKDREAAQRAYTTIKCDRWDSFLTETICEES